MDINTRDIAGAYRLTEHPDGSVTALRLSDMKTASVPRDFFNRSTGDLLPVIGAAFEG